MHGFCSQQNSEFHHKLTLGANRTQFQFAAAGDHIIEHRVEGELIFAGPLARPVREFARGYA